jgi:hypothetical protein
MPPVNRAEHEEIRVASLMTELEASVRDELRKRVLAHGGAREYADPEIFNTVEPLLRRVTESKERGASLLLELIGDDPPWRLRTHIRLSSHRRVAGPLIIFVKRRVLMPLTRWLSEYMLDNFERQGRLNLILLLCVEELAIENARLRRDLLRSKDAL